MRYPRERIVVNLAPASVRKEGPTYDLPIAVGVLLMQGLLPPNCLDDAVVVGELSLEGTVRHSRGVLPMAASARQKGFKRHLRAGLGCGRGGADPGYRGLSR